LDPNGKRVIACWLCDEWEIEAIKQLLANCEINVSVKNS